MASMLTQNPRESERTRSFARRRLLTLWLNQLRINSDADVVPHHSRSAVHAKVFAVDLRGSRGADALIAPRIFNRCRRSIHIEHDLFRDPMNGQISRDLQLAISRRLCRLGFEGDGRIFLRIKKMV